MKTKKILFIFTFILLFIYISLYLIAFIMPKVKINKNSNYYLYDTYDNPYKTLENNWVQIDNISPNIINATISIEDKKFFSHNGFDYLRIIKAIYKNILSASLKEGASTITQQYVKNLYLDFDKTFKRKIKEAWLTIRMETHYSKEEILEGYLNTINYGGVFGIQNASQYYFGKDASDITLAEASILAGIPKSPSNYEPIKNKTNSKERQKLVLEAMVKNKYISKQEALKAFEEELTYKGHIDTSTSSILYYQDAVLAELKNIKNIPKSLIECEGLKIYTFLDPDAQEYLDTSINTYPEDDIEVSGIMVKPEDGSVIALQGGKNYSNSEFNRALYSKRQVGSTIKPLLYYLALESGMTATSKFKSEKTNFIFSNNEIYAPQNFAGKYPNKEITMIEALAYSDNIYAVKTHLFLGEERLVELGQKLGINNLLAIPSLALGSIEITLIDMAKAYMTLANTGYLIEPHFIKKVLDGHGNTLYEYTDTKERILNESYVYILNDILKSTYDSAMIDYEYPTCYSIRNKMTHTYSVKTGTTDSDYLIFGYNKNILVGIWAGYDDNKEVSPTGGNLVKNIWVDTIEKYLENKEDIMYDKPDEVIGVLVNPITGEVATNADRNKRIVYYIKGTEPR